MAARGRNNSDAVLVLALASGKSVGDAARTAAVSERTVHRRLADPAFRRQVAAARTELLARAIGVLADGTTAAAATLRLLLREGSPPVRLAAARAILDQVTRGIELLDLAERVAALEEQAATLEPARGKRWNA